ncbi:hypothetical protein GTP29_17965 [Vibrio parahaemolyticus]|nr:hypothetical protein [Vibrio parahaemolyticus]
MVEPILVSLCLIGIAGYFLGIVRGRLSIARLQAFIDSGKVSYDGLSVYPTQCLSKLDRRKIDREICIYVRASHVFHSIVIGSLHPKESR